MQTSVAIIIDYTTEIIYPYTILLLNNKRFWTNDDEIIGIITKEEYNNYKMKFTADKYNL